MKPAIVMISCALLASIATADDAQPPSKSEPGKTGSDVKEPDKKDDKTVSDADAARFLIFFDGVVDVVVANKDQCEKMADGINKVIDDNREILELMNEAKANGKHLPPPAQDHVKAGVPKMKSGMAKCSKHEKIHVAFQRMDSIKRK